MTEEIEIEEHNLFESPVVKNLFPDLFVLKREIVFPSEDCYAQPESTCSLLTTNDYEYNIKVENNEDADDDAYLSNTEVVGYNEPALEHKNPYLIPSQSKFILGSKTEDLEHTIEKLQAKIMRMNIVIKDVEPYLVRSKRFCSKCLILFSDSSKINTHNLEFHMTDKAHGTNQHQGHIQLIHGKSLVKESIHLDQNIFTTNDTARNGKVKRKRIYQCKLCQYIFPNAYTLFNHKKLHSKINKKNETSKAIEQQKGEKPVIHENTEGQGFSHTVEDVFINDGTAIKECENTIKKDDLKIKKIFQCKICSKFCHNSYALAQHEKQHFKLKEKNLKSQGANQNDKQYNQENSEACRSNHLLEDFSRSDEPSIKQCKVAIKNEEFKIRKMFQCKICHKFCHNSYALAQHEKQHFKLKEKYPKLEGTHQNDKQYNQENSEACGSNHLVEDFSTSDEPSTKQCKVANKNEEFKIRKMFQCKICHIFCPNNNDLEKHECLHSKVKENECKANGTEEHQRDNHKGANIATTENAKKTPGNISERISAIIEKRKLYSCKMCPMVCRNAYIREKHEKVHEKLKDIPLYKCDVCNAEFSFSYKMKRHRERHFDNVKQKTQNQGQAIVKLSKMFPCDICKAVFSSSKNLKRHIYSKTDSSHFKKQCAWEQEHNKKQVKIIEYTKKTSNTVKQNHNQLVLKSVLYKCQKCDVHFLFAKTAQNHVQHMDMLVNWKCPICLRIFKIQDKYLHVMQHNDENEIHVYNLTSDELLKVLYNCPKCTLHFGEEEFLYHYNLCGNNFIFQSLYCRICDILIEQKTMLDHSYHHKEGLASDFTIVVTQVVNSTDTKKPSNRLPLLKMYYCKDCECYVSKSKLHSNSSCINRKKYICKLCGLPIPIEYMPNHGKFHTVHGNFKISNFIFLDIQTGNQITPPIPSFPQCESCQVHFTSKAAIKRHICGEKVSTLCTICDKKFTYVALRLHVPFHSVSSTNNKKELNSTVKTVKTVNDAKESILQTIHLNQSHIDPSILEEICRRKLVISIPRLELPLPDQNKIFSTKPLPRIVFCCNSCELAFNAYDRVVEHCQKHYEDKGALFSGENCKLCGLTFETKCSYKHSLLENDNKDYVKVKFDLDFFMQDNSIWAQHVFGTIDSDHKEAILNSSIYKSEARIKMIIVQEGSPSLTIYQCDKCGCCVSKNIYNHTKNSCFHIRKHICNTCGLAFVSYITKETHEDIHRTSDVGLKDYRLVQFNREEDKDYNESVISSLNKKYVLYQCRNCNGIVNVTTFMKHICKPMDLHKCTLCGLLIYNEDLDIHIEKHNTCNNYLQQNMKILLCGQIVEERQNLLLPTYTGFVCDYTFYKCAKCDVCVRDFQCSNHICTDIKIKCNLCDLLFLSNFHKKLHKQDTDFTKANINIIEFNFKQNGVEDNSDQINTTLDSLLSQNTSSIEIYKCPICCLHFLDKQSTFAHLKSCNPKLKVSKQTCSKCGIMFTSKILFNHLIKHHGNDNKHYKFNIIDVDKINTIFKCSVCNLHFTTYSKAYEHTILCDGSAVGEKCTNCELIISPACLQDHNMGHSKNYKYTKFLTVPVATPKAIKEMTSKFNDALIKRLDLAKDSLSKLNFSNFSNVLYSCEVCNVYFIDIISIYSHFLSETHDSVIHELRDNCKICNFDFLLSDLTSHVFVHHKKWGLGKKNFVIIDSYDLF